MTRSWLLTHLAAAILSVCIVAARGETCAPPNVAHVALWAGKKFSGPLICPYGEGACFVQTAGGPPVIEVVCLTPTEEAEAQARGR